VKEAFAEFDVPLIKDGFVDSLNFNAAGRVTDYSTSGTVTTWKLGLTSQINSDIRVRGTYSRDIRAPNLNELFSQGISTQAQVRDPRTGNFVTVFSVVGGNPALQPEIAKTLALGMVLTPSFLNRFNLSVDYYNISLSGAIQTVSIAQIEARCLAGEQLFCDQYIYGGPGGILSEVRRVPLNLSGLKTSGIDVQMDWQVPLLTGTLALRARQLHTHRPPGTAGRSQQLRRFAWPRLAGHRLPAGARHLQRHLQQRAVFGHGAKPVHRRGQAERGLGADRCGRQRYPGHRLHRSARLLPDYRHAHRLRHGGQSDQQGTADRGGRTGARFFGNLFCTSPQRHSRCDRPRLSHRRAC
jgi:hypothetical protein